MSLDKKKKPIIANFNRMQRGSVFSFAGMTPKNRASVLVNSPKNRASVLVNANQRKGVTIDNGSVKNVKKPSFDSPVKSPSHRNLSVTKLQKSYSSPKVVKPNQINFRNALKS